MVTRQCGVFVQRFRSCTADPRIRLDLQWRAMKRKHERKKKKETGKRFLFFFFCRGETILRK